MSDDQRSEEKNERPRIKVTDRRKFTASGEVRLAAAEPASESAPVEEPAPQPPAAETPAPPEAAGEPASPRRAAGEPAPEPPSGGPSGTTPSIPPEGTSESFPQPDGEPSGAPSGAAGPGDINDLPRDFTAFIEGMYIETMLYLGAMPDPRTGEPVEDLDMAKYKIDLLGMLEEKTRGNLTDEEAQQLEEVLYQLRMFYVQTRKTGAGS